MCVLGYDTVLWLEVSNSMGTAYIRVDPTVPKNGQWSYDVTGSPNWDKVLVDSYSGSSANSYVKASTAKNFWKAGFRVVGAYLSKTFN